MILKQPTNLILVFPKIISSWKRTVSKCIKNYFQQSSSFLKKFNLELENVRIIKSVGESEEKRSFKLKIDEKGTEMNTQSYKNLIINL